MEVLEVMLEVVAAMEVEVVGLVIVLEKGQMWD